MRRKSTKNRITHLFKKWIVKRPEGQCQILFSIYELDKLINEISKEVNKMEVKENECIIQYDVNEKIIEFEEQLIQLFRDNNFKLTGSGYGCGIRDLCFKKKK